ncbi:DUF1476 domain-containing protein [Microvirga terricola]|uniref:DUF1476 domain-containing protein n=1 Tax=Microvirga terricola TaxID=2719797 RepID=A0ABX0VC48_9HYPH|nr:DUF1476 domain-containing protein [Microvirga terricola]NIX77263.1 DUF1476 domain-containing protein [Microvirga terricola]
MTIFNDRERGFEQMFVQEEETRFKAVAKRDKLIGLWAAEQMGLIGEAASRYAERLMESVVASPTDEAIVSRIHADFEIGGVAVSDDQIRDKMQELLGLAFTQVRSAAS